MHYFGIPKQTQSFIVKNCFVGMLLTWTIGIILCIEHPCTNLMLGTFMAGYYAMIVVSLAGTRWLTFFNIRTRHDIRYMLLFNTNQKQIYWVSNECMSINPN